MIAATSPPNPVALALAWTLLNAVWQASAIWLIYLGCRRATRNAALRGTLAQAALIALLVLQAMTFAYLLADRVAFDPVGALMRDAANEPRPALGVAVITLEPLAGRSRLGAALAAAQPFLSCVALAWCLLAALQLAGAARDWRALRRELAAATPLLEAASVQYERAARAMGIERPLRFLRSSAVTLPATAGWLRPVILLPGEDTLAIASKDLRSLVIHELAHVARRDAAHALVRAGATWLYGWHPSARAIARHATNDAEEAADDLAGAAIGSRSDYARALLHAEERRMPVRLTLSAGDGSLRQRLIRLATIEPSEMNRSRRSRLGAALVVGPLLVAIAAAGLAAGAAERREDAWLRSRSLSDAIVETIAWPIDNPKFGVAVGAAITLERDGIPLTDPRRRESLERVALAAAAGFAPAAIEERFARSLAGLTLGTRRRLACGEFGTAVEREELANSLLRESEASSGSAERDRFARASLLVTVALPAADSAAASLLALGNPKLYQQLAIAPWAKRRLYAAARLQTARASALTRDVRSASEGASLTPDVASDVNDAFVHAPYFYDYWAARVPEARRVAVEAAR